MIARKVAGGPRRRESCRTVTQELPSLPDYRSMRRRTMRSYASSTTIDAAPEAVWAVLVDGARYTDWDSGVVRLEGTIAKGERIKVVSSANPKRAFPVEVTA